MNPPACLLSVWLGSLGSAGSRGLVSFVNEARRLRLLAAAWNVVVSSQRREITTTTTTDLPITARHDCLGAFLPVPKLLAMRIQYTLYLLLFPRCISNPRLMRGQQIMQVGRQA